MKIDLAIGSDHRGYEMKEFLTKFLTPIDRDIKYDITTFMDIATYSDTKKVDYPDIVQSLAKDMETPDKKQAGWEVFNRGILICGSGYGVCMAANRHPFIRAVTVRTHHEAEMARRHNDANVLCLGARTVNPFIVRDIVNIFLKTEFEGGRHETRIRKFS